MQRNRRDKLLKLLVGEGLIGCFRSPTLGYQKTCEQQNR
jgi:hypothetical protein